MRWNSLCICRTCSHVCDIWTSLLIQPRSPLKLSVFEIIIPLFRIKMPLRSLSTCLIHTLWFQQSHTEVDVDTSVEVLASFISRVRVTSGLFVHFNKSEKNKTSFCRQLAHNYSLPNIYHKSHFLNWHVHPIRSQIRMQQIAGPQFITEREDCDIQVLKCIRKWH